MAAITAPATATAGTTITLDAAASAAMAGRTIVDWLWTIVSAPAGASLTSAGAESTGLQLPAEGSYLVRVTITDSSGASDEAVHAVTVSAAVAPPVTTQPEASGGGGGGGDAGWLLPLMLLLAWPWLGERPRCLRRSPKEIDRPSVDCRTRN